MFFLFLSSLIGSVKHRSSNNSDIFEKVPPKIATISTSSKLIILTRSMDEGAIKMGFFVLIFLIDHDLINYKKGIISLDNYHKFR